MVGSVVPTIIWQKNHSLRSDQTNRIDADNNGTLLVVDDLGGSRAYHGAHNPRQYSLRTSANIGVVHCAGQSPVTEAENGPPVLMSLSSAHPESKRS